MENKTYQDEFEQFLRDEVKQHRMYPSDHIWKGIRTELHGYKAWPALTFISLFIITALTVSTLIGNNPLHEQPVIKKQLPIAEEIIDNPSPIAAKHREDNSYFGKMAAGHITEETFDNNHIAYRQRTPAVNTLTTETIESVIIAAEHVAAATINKTIAARQQQIDNVLVPAEREPETDITATYNNEPGQTISAGKNMQPANSQQAKKALQQENLVDRYVVTKLKEMPRRNARFGFQFYVTPSTSYRRLSDEKVKDVVQPAVNTNTTSNISLSGTNADVNRVVRHRPAVGLEIGFAALYNLSSRLKFKTGAQLNVRQYFIETFQSHTNDLTSLSLINNRGVETINFYSPYNNNTGYKSTQLQNRVYQVSIPVGIQWDAIQGRNWGVNTEASVQPTLMLNNSSYLLSTDYKHYTDGAQFMRKFNINTSVGLNLTYRSGTSSWQIGPQIRYQHLPTYSNAYPIKEHLMDYGVRLGFTKQIN